MSREPICPSLPTAGEQWKHWKGNVYSIVGLGYDARDCSMVVLYQIEDGAPVWSRPLGDFLGLANAETPRFAFVSPPKDAAA